MSRALDSEEPLPETLGADLEDRFSWSSVFHRIERVWTRLAARSVDVES